MIDWFRGSIPWLHDPLPSGKVVSVHPDGSMDWEITKKTDIRGSHESTIKVRSSGGDGQGRATHLDIDGNITKFVQGHNVVGINDLSRILSLAFDRIVQALSEHIPPETAAFPRQRIEQGDYLLKMVDINEMYEVGNDQSVDSWLHAAEMRAIKRAGRATSNKGTVYLGQNSRRWAFKFYNKFKEIDSRSKAHRLPDEFNATPLKTWARGKLRAELRLMALELKDLGITHGKHLTPERVTDLFNQYLGRIDMQKQATLIDKQLMELPRTVAGTYQLWRQGACIRSMLPHNTFYRHRRKLLEHGIDIHMPPADPETSNVVPMLRIIEAKPVGVPQWAFDNGLVAC